MVSAHSSSSILYAELPWNRCIICVSPRLYRCGYPAAMMDTETLRLSPRPWFHTLCVCVCVGASECVFYIHFQHTASRQFTRHYSATSLFTTLTICITQALKIFGFYVVCFDSARYNRHYMAERSGAVSWGTALHAERWRFDSRRGHWDLTLTYSFRPQCDPGFDSAFNINEYHGYLLDG